ncbi:MAG: hypothetical protein MUC96_28285, partial [Myxococcaceae bacterium]|nr:hypothetical protein [Myxococcaceae bacterium]
MKMQALALGAALGFLAAITPSCGMQTCSTANCDGCCQGTMCVKRPDNALNSTCGTSGNACVNCAASNTTCDATTFTCATGAAGGGTAGGGTGGGTAGGGTTCDGCRLANGTCQPRNTNRQNNNICGSNGDMCRSCVGTATPVCDNGACIAPPKKVGDQCMQDSECQASLGTMAVCKRGTSVAGNFSYPGGHCTVENCGSQGTDDCPMDSTCLALTGIFGEENTSCFANCTMPANCRTGWSCINIGSMAMPRGVCLPSEFASMDFQLDVGGVVGNPCANSAACRAPTPNAPGAGGFCVPEARQFPDGGIAPGRDGGPQFTSFVGGYCSRECRRDADCDPNGDDNDRVAICIGT